MAAPLSLAIPIHIQIEDNSRRDSLVCLASLDLCCLRYGFLTASRDDTRARILGSTRTLQKISVSSQESLRGSCYPTAENRARNLLVDVVEWIHRAFHPSLVYLQIGILVSIPSRADSPSQVVVAMKQSHLCHESSNGILGLRRARIVRDQSTLPR
jgi:hypothetical protein